MVFPMEFSGAQQKSVLRPSDFFFFPLTVYQQTDTHRGTYERCHRHLSLDPFVYEEEKETIGQFNGDQTRVLERLLSILKVRLRAREKTERGEALISVTA